MLRLPKEINVHYGRNIDKMPELLSSVDIPMPTYGIMKSRLIYGDNDSDLWNNRIDSSDLIIYPKNNENELYVLLTVDNKGKITDNGKRALELIREDNLASNGGAIVERLDDLIGDNLIAVSRNEITTEKYLPKDRLLDENLWKALARHPDIVPSGFEEDENLLERYIDEVESRTKEEENMALYVGKSLEDKTTLKAWCVGGLGGRSGVSGRCDLDYFDGRLLGIAPEALSALNIDPIKYTSTQITQALKKLELQGLSKTLINKLEKEN